MLYLLLAGVANAAMIDANGCHWEAVSAAINLAQVGDVVRVPAGTCTWDTQLTITKGIYLMGAGIEKTTITSNINTGAIMAYVPSDYAANNPFRLSGFTLDLANKSRGLSLGAGKKRPLPPRQKSG